MFRSALHRRWFYVWGLFGVVWVVGLGPAQQSKQPSSKATKPTRSSSVISITTPQPARVPLQSTGFAIGAPATAEVMLEQLDDTSAVITYQRRKFKHPQDSFFSRIETKDAIYTYHKDKGRFINDSIYEAENGKSYGINLPGTVRLADPLGYYEMRALVKKLHADQSLTVEVVHKDTKEKRTLTLPPGSVTEVFFGHEIEWYDRQPYSLEIQKGMSTYWLTWGPIFGKDSKLHVYAPRFRGYVRKWQQPGLYTPALAPVAEVVGAWKKQDAAAALGIKYTWTPAWAHEQSGLDRLGLAGRLVKGWNSLRPEQRQMIKDFAELTGNAIEAVNRIAQEQGAVETPKKAKTKTAKTAPAEPKTKPAATTPATPKATKSPKDEQSKGAVEVTLNLVRRDGSKAEGTLFHYTVNGKSYRARTDNRGRFVVHANYNNELAVFYDPGFGNEKCLERIISPLSPSKLSWIVPLP